VRGPGAEGCTGSSGIADPEEADWRGLDPAVAEDLVDPAAGKSSATGDPNKGIVAVAEEGVATENPRRSPSSADDAEELSPLGAGDPVGVHVSVGEAKLGAEDPIESAPAAGVGGDWGDMAGGDSVLPVGRGDQGGTAADAVVAGGRSEASGSEAIS
jgi:hypothetical protein